MSLRARVLLATVCGLVLAAIVHLGTVLAIPALARNDALTRTRSTLNADQAVLVKELTAPGEAPAPSWLPNPDPDVAVGVCAFNLDEGPVRIAARTGTLFESISIHGRTGAFYAITDQAAVRGAIDLVVMTRRQYDEVLARSDEDEVSRDVRIVAPVRQGYAVVRVLAALPSQRAEANDAARSVACTLDPQGDDG